MCTMIGHRIPERETFRMLPLISFRILIFYAEEKVPHATVIPRLRHRGFYFPPSDKSDGPVTADWGMRYVCRLPEKLICKLEAFRDAEVERSVKKSSGLYAYGTSR